MLKDSSIIIRVNSELKREFRAILAEEDNTVNRALRQYIAAYVAEHRKQKENQANGG